MGGWMNSWMAVNNCTVKHCAAEWGQPSVHACLTHWLRRGGARRPALSFNLSFFTRDFRRKGSFTSETRLHTSTSQKVVQLQNRKCQNRPWLIKERRETRQETRQQIHTTNRLKTCYRNSNCIIADIYTIYIYTLSELWTLLGRQCH